MTGIVLLAVLVIYIEKILVAEKINLGLNWIIIIQ